MRARLGAGEFIRRAPRDDDAPVVDVLLQHPFERQSLGTAPAINERQEDDAEVQANRRVLEQIVQHLLRHHIAAQLDDDAHTGLVGVIVDGGDAVDLLFLDLLGDVLDQFLFDDLIRQFRDDDRVLAVVHRLDRGFGLHRDRAAPGRIRRLDALRAQNQPVGREVGAGNEGHQVFERRVGMVDQVRDAVADLAQVVRRHVGRHTDRDSLTAVADQVRELAGKYGRLAALVVEGRLEIDRVLLDVFEHLHRQRHHTRFRVAVGGGGVVVDRAEVSLPIDERVAQRERLRHADHRAVKGKVAVGMVLAQTLADDLRAFDVSVGGRQSQLAHGVQDTPLNRLQTVAHIGQGARDDGAHRVAEIRGPHFVGDLDAGTVVATAIPVRDGSIIIGRTAAGRRYRRRVDEKRIVNHRVPWRLLLRQQKRAKFPPIDGSPEVLNLSIFYRK